MEGEEINAPLEGGRGISASRASVKRAQYGDICRLHRKTYCWKITCLLLPLLDDDDGTIREAPNGLVPKPVGYKYPRLSPPYAI
jgi:hypothetical protein